MSRRDTPRTLRRSAIVGGGPSGAPTTVVPPAGGATGAISSAGAKTVLMPSYLAARSRARPGDHRRGAEVDDERQREQRQPGRHQRRELEVGRLVVAERDQGGDRVR